MEIEWDGKEHIYKIILTSKQKRLSLQKDTAVVIKILEKAVHKQLINFLETNNLPSDKQFGYRKRISTELRYS